MSAKTATSTVVPKTINGKKRNFRQITTYDVDANNLPIKDSVKKKIVEEIIVYDSNGQRDQTATDKLIQDYKSSEKNTDLVTDIDGRSYVTVRDADKDTNYTDLSLRKEFIKTGQDSLTNNLNTRTVDVLTAQFPDTQAPSAADFWRPIITPFDNVATQFAVFSDADQVNLENVGNAINDLVEGTSFGTPNINITAGARRTEYEDLLYPLDIARSSQDRVRFQMEARSGRTISFNLSQQNPFSFGTRTTTNIAGSVTLPIQGGIQDTNSVDYTESRLNPVTGLMAAASMDPTGAAKTLLDALRSPAEDIQGMLNAKETQNIINVLRVYLAQTAVGGSGLIPRTTGAILNPNMELLLNSPTLRKFSFNFRMSARSAPEATQIRKIIRFFKQGMSVKRSSSSLFVISPNIFKIAYLTGSGQIHPSIGRIKDCALTAINTQYTPDGTYMTYDDPAKTMTSYNISMEFTELEPLTESDYFATSGPLADPDQAFQAINAFPGQIGY